MMQNLFQLALKKRIIYETTTPSATANLPSQPVRDLAKTVLHQSDGFLPLRQGGRT